MSGDRRGRLRVYLGAAPGVGKTVAMLGEGRRRADRGTDVVIGVVEDHGRVYTRSQVAGLESVPRRTVSYRGTVLSDLDVDAVLARRPQVALIDELAHRNAPGGRTERRWQDVELLLDAGIDVISTVNIQHLDSVRDVVAQITGVEQDETLPDAFVRAADQVELVDMTAQALRRRMAHGHIYPADRVDTALANYFREGNLTALRELALLWVADRVDEGLAKYRAEHRITGTWPARERIVVALAGGPEGTKLLRRGARIAGRVIGRDLMAVHVLRADGTTTRKAADGGGTAELERQRQLVESLGGSFHTVVGDDLPAAVLDFARAVNGTQIVVGASARRPVARLLRPSTSMAVVRGSGDIDVHMVTHERVAEPLPRWPRVLPAVPRWSWPAAVLVPVVLTAAMLPWRGSVNLSSVLLVFLLGVLASSLIGGVLPAVVSALIAGVLANLVFTPPTGSLTIAEPENVFSIAVFVIVGVTVASIVDRSRRRARQADRGRAEAQVLAAAATSVAGAADPVAAVLAEIRAAFGMSAVELRGADGQCVWRHGAGASDRGRPDVVIVVGGPAAGGDSRPELLMWGRALAAADRRLAEVLAGQAVEAWRRRELETEAAHHDRLRQSESVRTALLAAVSHDLRSPLATIKASVSSLLDHSVEFSAEDRAELLTATDQAADQLDGLLSNLLDLSRLQTGAVAPVRRPVAVDEVVHRALIGVAESGVIIDIPDDLPLADTDSGLLERVVANLVSNAVRHATTATGIRVLAGVARQLEPAGTRLEIRVVDHGPGVAQEQRSAIFRPFQRLGDTPNGAGLGLGLAVARGLAEAVDATIEADDTPGGGLTMIVTVPIAGARNPA